MVVGSGIDVMAVHDMRRELTRPWTVADGIFRESELHCCNCSRQAARRLASCFVTKEAALKALGVQVSDLDLFRDVEVIPGEKVEVRFHGRAQQRCRNLGVKHIVAAVHSDRHLAAAMVILEG